MLEQVGSRELIDDPIYFAIWETKSQNGKLVIYDASVVVCIFILVDQDAPWVVSIPVLMQKVHL